MAQQYNINDPYDLDIMRANYDNYSEEDWQAFIDFTQLPENKRVFSFEDRGCLMRMAKKRVNITVRQIRTSAGVLD